MTAIAQDIDFEAIKANPTLKRCTGKSSVPIQRQRSLRSGNGCSTCGATEGIYWAHIDGTHPGLPEKWCDACGKTVSLLFVEGESGTASYKRVHPHAPRTSSGSNVYPRRPWNGSSHASTQAISQAISAGEQSASSDSSPAFDVPAPNLSSNAAQAKALLELLMRPTITAEQIAEMVKTALVAHDADLMTVVGELVSEKLAAFDHPTPVTLNVVHPNGDVKTIANAHAALPDVITALMRRKNVMLVGPMGTGKSTLAEHAAEALSLEFDFMAVGPQTSKSDILGYMTADGTYVPSSFRRAYESGKLWLFDELDAAHPGVLTIINAALSNGHMSFPDGLVTRHDDFRCVAAANTYGRGPDRMYVGRQAIDAATLDRFIVLEVEVDQALETTLAMATGYDAAKCDRVISYVREVRESAVTKKMAIGFSPRATVNACDMLDAGMVWDKVLSSCIRKGISDADWSKVSSGIREPYL